jgi:hypothetical protein
MRLPGLESHRRRRTFVSNGSGISRGDRNRNARLGRLRELVPVTNAIVGIDLAGKKQMAVVTDHDSKVLARRTFRCRAWDLGAALDWAGQQAASKGFTGATVSCEPTGHRWRVLGQLATGRGGAQPEVPGRMGRGQAEERGVPIAARRLPLRLELSAERRSLLRLRPRRGDG